METDDEAIEVYPGADHRGAEGAPGRCGGGGSVPQAWDQRGAFYTWRSKYGRMEVSDAKRLKGLEEENAKLKKLLAESMLDVSTLREMLAKNF